MNQFIWIFSGAAVFFGAIFIHELGHYLYGRYIVGISKKNIKIVMNSWPQYVALRNKRNNKWFSPNESKYRSVYKDYDQNLQKLWLFISSGYLFAMLVLLLTWSALLLLNLDPTRIIRISLLINGIILLLDVVAIAANKQTGDISSLWLISRLKAVSLVLLVLAVHCLGLWIS